MSGVCQCKVLTLGSWRVMNGFPKGYISCTGQTRYPMGVKNAILCTIGV